MEITKSIDFSTDQIQSIRMHSILNIMTAVQMQIIELSEIVKMEENEVEKYVALPPIWIG